MIDVKDNSYNLSDAPLYEARGGAIGMLISSVVVMAFVFFKELSADVLMLPMMLIILGMFGGNLYRRYRAVDTTTLFSGTSNREMMMFMVLMVLMIVLVFCR